MRVAILGASSKPARYSNMAQRMLVEQGHEVLPVSRRETEVMGVPAVATPGDIYAPVDTLTIYLGGNHLAALKDDILALNPGRVIFNPGTENDEVEAALESAGIPTLRACTLVLLRTGQF